MSNPCPNWYGDDQKYSWIFWDTGWSWPRDWDIDQWDEAMMRGTLWNYNDKGKGIYRYPAGQRNERITSAGFPSMGWRESLNRPIEGEIYKRTYEILNPGRRSVFIDEENGCVGRN